MFKETIEFNGEFVKNNPINAQIRYVYNNISKMHFLNKKNEK